MFPEKAYMPGGYKGHIVVAVVFVGVFLLLYNSFLCKSCARVDVFKL